jgi:thiamine biosynthesis protein ThiS
MIRVRINNQTKYYKKRLSVRQLLEAEYSPGKMTICKINGKLIRRQSYQETKIKENDEIVIIEIVGGG